MNTLLSKLFIFRHTCLVFLIMQVSCTNNDVLPESWSKDWNNPGVEYRPLQIVHGSDIRDKAAYFKDSCGLGGVVYNVPFSDDYLKSEEEWKLFVAGAEAMLDHNLRVWIYDEKGYPSLGAGGRVLEKYPELEALEMVYDAGSKNPFAVRPCYEYTHASNNYHVSRRYPNPLNPLATEKFIEITHQAYLDHLGHDLYGEIEAFFTDEPSMMAVNPGELSDEVRKSVAVADPVDPAKKNLPMVSWVEGLPEIYKDKYGEDLDCLSLFKGDEEKDKVTRQRFWSLLAEINQVNYYKAIQKWCDKSRSENNGKGPISSGHGLREENPFHHVPLDGNKLYALMGLDLPGLDQLSSDPSIWTGNAWMSTAFPASAAMLTGQRRVMSEISDFEQKLHGEGPATVEMMQAAAAWQMIFGVTDFTLYYSIDHGAEYPYRNEKSHKEYCDFVGRINSILMKAEPIREALLYYPIYDMQREYIPEAKEIQSTIQSRRMQLVENSFIEAGKSLLQAQIQFVLADYLTLGNAQVTDKGTLKLGNKEYSSLFIPEGVVLPESVQNILAIARDKGLKVVNLVDEFGRLTSDRLQVLLGIDEKLVPANPEIAYGKFLRDGREIFVLLNTGKDVYTGTLLQTTKPDWVELEPQSGLIKDISPLPDHSVPIQLNPNQTKIYIKQ